MPQNFDAAQAYDTSWADIWVSFTIPGGATLKNLKSNGVKFGAKLDSGRSQETGGGRETGETTGMVKNEGSIGLSRKANADLIAALAAVAPERDGAKQIGLVSFSVLIKHILVVDPDTIYTTELIGCRYRSMVSDLKPGTEADYMDIDLKPLQIFQYLPDGTKVSLL